MTYMPKMTILMISLATVDNVDYDMNAPMVAFFYQQYDWLCLA
jgi:hypothetical protein